MCLLEAVVCEAFLLKCSILQAHGDFAATLALFEEIEQCGAFSKSILAAVRALCTERSGSLSVPPDSLASAPCAAHFAALYAALVFTGAHCRMCEELQLIVDALSGCVGGLWPVATCTAFACLVLHHLRPLLASFPLGWLKALRTSPTLALHQPDVAAFCMQLTKTGEISGDAAAAAEVPAIPASSPDVAEEAVSVEDAESLKEGADLSLPFQPGVDTKGNMRSRHEVCPSVCLPDSHIFDAWFTCPSECVVSKPRDDP